MTDHDQPHSGRQQLELIHDMIRRARGDIRGRSFHLLLWGWVILAGSLGHYLLLRFTAAAHPEWAWTVIVAGLAGSFRRGWRDRRSRGALTWGGRIYATVWLTFLANYVILLFFMEQINYLVSPLVLLLAAGATWLSGTIVRFAPLRWGALFIWAMAVLAFTQPLPGQLLAGAAAVAGGYLVPGYLLRRKDNEPASS